MSENLFRIFDLSGVLALMKYSLLGLSCTKTKVNLYMEVSLKERRSRAPLRKKLDPVNIFFNQIFHIYSRGANNVYKIVNSNTDNMISDIIDKWEDKTGQSGEIQNVFILNHQTNININMLHSI